MSNLQDVYYEWMNNPQFKEEFKKDPLLAIKNAGFDLSESDTKKIISKIKGENEKLDDRVNK